MSKKVLLIGLDSDLHLDAAIVELRKQGVDFIRLNPERMTRHNTQIEVVVTPAGCVASFCTYSGAFSADEISGVWCRYALDAMSSSDVADDDKFPAEEFLVSFKGALQQIPAARWINDPHAEARADNKPHQLALTSMCGLRVPPSIVSQDKNKLIDFVRMHGPCIIKALGDVPLLLCDDGLISGNFAALLDTTALEQGRWDASCPVFLQKRVEKDADIRVTVIDEKVFAAVLHQPIGSKARNVDFRNAGEVQTSPYSFPESEGRALVLLLERLGVRYASCDFCLRGDEHWFLEANVAGNYLWTELEAGLQITSAVVNGLQDLNTRS